MLRFRSVIVFLALVVLGILVSACELWADSTTTYVVLVTTGELQIDWTVRAEAVNIHHGDELTYRLPRGGLLDNEPPPTTITVEQAGLTTLTLEQWERETSSGLTADIWLRKRAFFAISAPEGATIELLLWSGVDPLAVRAKVDYDADGTVDAELTPTAAAKGNNLDVGERGARVEAQVEQHDEGTTVVNFLPTDTSASVAGVVYAVYPGHPHLQFYSEPFVVKKGSYILYAAYSERGQRQATQEVEVLGGIDDVQVTATIDGDPLEVQTSVPGQDAIVSFNGEVGQTIEVTVGPMTGGIQPRNQATLVLTGPDGTVLREVGPYGIPALGTDPWSDTLDLPSDGIYTIVIDPRAANVISTTVTVSSAP